MDGVWRVLGGFAGTVGLWVLSALVLLAAYLVAVYASLMFPLTGQWREKFKTWRNRGKG
jgi:hypothetical protein